MSDFIIPRDIYTAFKVVQMGEPPAECVDDKIYANEYEHQLTLGWDRNGNAIDLYADESQIRVESVLGGQNCEPADKLWLPDVADWERFVKRVQEHMTLIVEPSNWQAILQRG